MAPSDYHLFGFLKERLRGKRFQDEDEIKSAVNEWVDGQPTDFLLADYGINFSINCFDSQHILLSNIINLLKSRVS